MSDTFKPFWPKDEAQSNEQVGLSDTPKKIDLSKPDAAAAELADTLQTVASNSLFTRVALTTVKWGTLTTRWVIRPLVWLPIKYFSKAVWWSFINSFSSAGENERSRERRRKEESSPWYQG